MARVAAVVPPVANDDVPPVPGRALPLDHSEAPPVPTGDMPPTAILCRAPPVAGLVFHAPVLVWLVWDPMAAESWRSVLGPTPPALVIAVFEGETPPLVPFVLSALVPPKPLVLRGAVKIPPPVDHVPPADSLPWVSSTGCICVVQAKQNERIVPSPKDCFIAVVLPVCDEVKTLSDGGATLLSPASFVCSVQSVAEP